MKDLEKVQKTLSDVFDYLNGNNLQLVGKELLTDVGDAHRIVENLAIHGVVFNEAGIDEDIVVNVPHKSLGKYSLKKIEDSEVECCPYCGKCKINYDYDGSRLGWDCKRLP